MYSIRHVVNLQFIQATQVQIRRISKQYFRRSLGELITDYSMYSYTCILFDTLQYFTVVDSDQSSDAYSSASSDHESSDTEGM